MLKNNKSSKLLLIFTLKMILYTLNKGDRIRGHLKTVKRVKNMCRTESLALKRLIIFINVTKGSSSIEQFNLKLFGLWPIYDLEWLLIKMCFSKIKKHNFKYFLKPF